MNIRQQFIEKNNWMKLIEEKIWKLFKRVVISAGNYMNDEWLSYFLLETFFFFQESFSYFAPLHFNLAFAYKIYVDNLGTTTEKLLKSSCIIKWKDVLSSKLFPVFLFWSRIFFKFQSIFSPKIKIFFFKKLQNETLMPRHA